ncbi:hypothetical protein [Spiroplasma chrysopicola]|uniref:Transmembrane protein n=1 Tax=Spiroplasma chrysopicola DF-1 TaxID=1276227 RepID=R4UB72_9MOLU|nr:hypothetical protein [Spiroplasma chrysopicola]AGM25129.1 hypothetical protein SCHRY_v1c05510 [Spiroplasma chrysopicola DF-1]
MAKQANQSSWVQKSKDEINNVLAKFNKSKVIFKAPTKKRQIVVRWMLFIGPLLTLVAIFIFAMFYIKKTPGVYYVIPVLTIILGLVFDGFIIFYLIKWTKIMRLQKNILDILDFKKLYDWGLQETFEDKIDVINISSSYNLPPSKVINLENDTKVDQVLNLKHSNCEISLGTITHKTKKKTSSNYAEPIFYRVPILTLKPLKKSVIDNVTIQLVDLNNDFFRPAQTIKTGNSAFDDIFVVGSNQKDLSRVLPPSVQAKLISEEQTSVAIPVMIFEDGILTLIFQSYLVEGWNDHKMVINDVEFFSDWEHVTNDIITKMQIDLNWLKDSLNWANQFDIIDVK